MNAGPSVFVSSTGPNPIMVQVVVFFSGFCFSKQMYVLTLCFICHVQPLPFQPGASFGSVPVGTVQHGSGLAGGSAATGFLPRNIDIRIRTGALTFLVKGFYLMISGKA